MIRKHIVFIILVILLGLSLVFTAKAEGPSKEPSYDKDTIIDMIGFYSDKYNVSRSVMKRIVSGESMYDVNIEDGDMSIKCPIGQNKGKPVRARGLVQITECYFPNISDEQAYDPNFSLNFLAEHLSQGMGELWSTY